MADDTLKAFGVPIKQLLTLRPAEKGNPPEWQYLPEIDTIVTSDPTYTFEYLDGCPDEESFREQLRKHTTGAKLGDLMPDAQPRQASGGGGIANLARLLTAADIVAAEAAAASKAAAAEAARCEVALFEAMADAGMADTTVDGVKFKLDTKTHYSVKADDRDALYEALKPFGRDGIFKTTFSVHAGTLDSTMREWEDQGGIPETVKDILSIFDEGKVKRPKVKL